MTLAEAWSHLPYAIAGWIFCCGLIGAATSRNLIHLVLCVAVLQTSSYVLLLAIGYHGGATAPVFVAGEADPGTPAVDAVVQALMLTDVVVEATVMALLLALAVQAHERAGTLDPERLSALQG